jgi:hypothetical protein
MSSLTLDENERTFLYDPLGGGPERLPYDGEWISLDALLEFNWKSNGKYYVAIVENEGNYNLRYLHLPVHQEADKVVTVRRGGAARVEPRITSSTVRRFWNENKRRPFLAKFAGGWYLVLWSSGEEWEWGYVYKDDILSVESVEVEPPQPPCEEETDLEARLATIEASANEIEGWLADIKKAANLE